MRRFEIQRFLPAGFRSLAQLFIESQKMNDLLVPAMANQILSGALRRLCYRMPSEHKVAFFESLSAQPYRVAPRSPFGSGDTRPHWHYLFALAPKGRAGAVSSDSLALCR